MSLWIWHQWSQSRGFHCLHKHSCNLQKKTREDVKVGLYNRCLTGKYRCHINLDLAQDGKAVEYLMEYAFNSPSLQKIQLSTRLESWANRTAGQSSSRSDRALDNICNDVFLYKQAQVRGAVQTAWNFFESRQVRMNWTVHVYTIHLENECGLIIRNPILPQNFGDSSLQHQHYIKRPIAGRGFNFLDYMKKGGLRKTLSWGLISLQQNVPRDSSSPAHYVWGHGNNEKGHHIARIRFLHPSNADLFSLRRVISGNSASSVQNGSTWEVTV